MLSLVSGVSGTEEEAMVVVVVVVVSDDTVGGVEPPKSRCVARMSSGTGHLELLSLIDGWTVTGGVVGVTVFSSFCFVPAAAPKRG